MTDITIPPAALEAAARQICGYERDQDVDWREYIGHARAAITAALKAWPGMDVERFMPDSGPYTIHLPLPTETSDE